MRIVGIGASAGGLAPLEEFFREAPPDTGMAFVIVQHMAPDQKAMLSELLQRITAMSVQEAHEGMVVKPNAVYVIPPGKEIRVVNDTLQLDVPAEPRGMRLPIDVLFSSLASAYSEKAIAVVLSGMGSDGTLGLQAIRATGGLTLVQQPDTAQFDAMPRNAIAAGCCDIIDVPARLPERIMAYTTRVHQPDQSHFPTRSMASVAPIIQILQQATKHDFSLYKPSTLCRRIERRMAIHDFTELSAYSDYLKDNNQEIQLLFKELLIGVTQFFRDPETWRHLSESALPDLLAARPPNQILRAWVVGCSTGEEAYSLAMVFTEALEHLSPGDNISFQIFASDLSPEAIAAARRGQYPIDIEAYVSEQRLARFFTRHGDVYQVKQSLRDRVLFAQHDVILEPPFTKLDLITCRNLLIYFDPMLQRRLLPLFHYSLRQPGLLMLGNSETVGRLNHLFSPIKSKVRLYQRLKHDSISGPSFLLKSFPPLSTFSREQPMPAHTVQPDTTDNLETAANHLLLQVYSPAAVVLNQDADIVYISGRTGKYLEPAAGKTNWNIHAMAREGLRAPLYRALKQAASQRDPVVLNDLEVQTGTGVQQVDLTVHALREPASVKDMTIVVFRDSAATKPNRKKNASSDGTGPAADVLGYQQEIERLTEEARSSREELQASNEELQATNEELQSANEELTTSKEEMQSMNEELQTINTELQAKLDDLAQAQSDMQNVLNSIEIAILFLDQHLNVRRYTARAATIISLRENDVGRPLRDLTTILKYPELENDAQETLDTLVVCEKQIATNEDRWFSVRIMPYRRLDNVVDGAVMTMVDITETKKLESSLRQESD